MNPQESQPRQGHIAPQIDPQAVRRAILHVLELFTGNDERSDRARATLRRLVTDTRELLELLGQGE